MKSVESSRVKHSEQPPAPPAPPASTLELAPSLLSKSSALHLQKLMSSNVQQFVEITGAAPDIAAVFLGSSGFGVCSHARPRLTVAERPVQKAAAMISAYVWHA